MGKDELLNKLSDYERGWIDGIWVFSEWREGTLMVGPKRYQQAVRDFLVSRGYDRQDVEAIEW